MTVICLDFVSRRISTMAGTAAPPVEAGTITDVGFVYTSALGDDTPFQLEVPTHQAGDAIFVWARGQPATPSIPEGRDTLNLKVDDFNLIDQRSNSFSDNVTLSWLIDTTGDIVSVAHTAGTAQMGIHVYRGVTAVGDTAVVVDQYAPVNDGVIPALSLTEVDGSSRVWCGIIFNQLKSSVGTPSGLTQRLASPSSLGGGSGASYDTTAGVTAFAAKTVSAPDTAYYMAWAVEMLAGSTGGPSGSGSYGALYTDLRTDTLYAVDGTDIIPFIDSTEPPRTAVWRSKKFIIPGSPVTAWGRVNGPLTDDVTVRLYGDGALISTDTVATRTPFRIPAKRARAWEIEIESTSQVSSVVIATSSEELTG